MSNKVFSVKNIHDMLCNVVENRYPKGLYNIYDIEPFATEMYDMYGYELIDIRYGGDIYNSNKEIIALREDIGITMFDKPRYNFNIQMFILDSVTWLLMQRSENKRLIFNCDMTDVPVPLLGTRLMDYKYITDIERAYLGSIGDDLSHNLETFIIDIVNQLSPDNIYNMYYLDSYNVLFSKEGSIKELRYEYLSVGNRRF